MTSEWKTVARITDPERLEMTRRAFGGDEVPIKSIIPIRANLPGHQGALVYLMDLDAITAEQRERLIAEISHKFDIPAAEIALNLEQGVAPILADQCSVHSSDFGLIANIVYSGLDEDWDEDWDDDIF